MGSSVRWHQTSFLGSWSHRWKVPTTICTPTSSSRWYSWSAWGCGDRGLWIYGQNDAPAAWFKECASFVVSCGWSQSKLDQCLFTLRDRRDPSKLVAAMGVHVDDTALGGDLSNPVFINALSKLKNRFPYRKWKIHKGEFCGAWYTQKTDKSIHMSMQSFAERIRPVNVPKGVAAETLNDSQIRILRAVSGSLNWLASQSRPDLSVQTSMSQQSFPKPTTKDFRTADHAVRHAKQESTLGITFKPVDPKSLTLVCHSDSAWANVGSHTKAGYMVGFTHANLQHGHEVSWTPAGWKSYRMPRAVNSTLAAESQAMSLASGTVEWLMLLLSELLDGPLDLPSCRDRSILVTDCKRLYGHLHSLSSPIYVNWRSSHQHWCRYHQRESEVSRSSCAVGPYTDRMLADGLTKDAGPPIDLLRACMKRARYQISPESTVLEQLWNEISDCWSDHRRRVPSN